MKKNRRKVLTALFVILSGIMAASCEPPDPSIPTLRGVDPGPGATFAAASLPYTYQVPVEFTGSVLQEYAVASYTATLSRLNDGVVEPGSAQNVTGQIGQTVTYDSGTGKNLYTWAGTVSITQVSGGINIGDHQVELTVQNLRSDATLKTKSVSVDFRLDQPADEFPGGDYAVKISGMTQDPPNCMMNQFLLSTGIGLISGQLGFTLNLPSGDNIPQVANPLPQVNPLRVYLPWPFTEVDVDVYRNQTNDGVLIYKTTSDVYIVDFTGFVPGAGIDCIISTGLEGAMEDLDPGDPDGFLRFDIVTIAEASGGTCILNPPAGACALIAEIDGDTF